MRLDLTLMQLDALKIMLRDAVDDDEQLWLDTIEGETDAFEMARKLLDAIETEQGQQAALTEQMDVRKVRRDRSKVREEQARLALCAIMECAKLDKLPLPEATLSLRTLPAKLAVNDPTAVPDEYTVPAPKPSMDLIKAAFSADTPSLPNWLRVEPERPSLTIRRK